ncbi:MAG: FAD:protein FMN transferase [Chloroflexota bacterium]
MNETRIMMGMPITVEVVDASVTTEAFDAVYAYFDYVDKKFSTYKDNSEISRINHGELTIGHASDDMRLVFELAEQTRLETDGYFDIEHDGILDPSGLVKGWAVYNAAEILHEKGFQHYFIDAGGDIQVAGRNYSGQNWRVGIRNPFNIHEIVKVIALDNCGVATSGTSIRGQHIYNPTGTDAVMDDIISLTVIGPNVYEADRFATAAYAMGRMGIGFIEQLDGFEGYLIDQQGRATLTSGFGKYVVPTLAVDEAPVSSR